MKTMVTKALQVFVICNNGFFLIGCRNGFSLIGEGWTWDSESEINEAMRLFVAENKGIGWSMNRNLFIFTIHQLAFGYQIVCKTVILDI